MKSIPNINRKGGRDKVFEVGSKDKGPSNKFYSIRETENKIPLTPLL